MLCILVGLYSVKFELKAENYFGFRSFLYYIWPSYIAFYGSEKANCAGSLPFLFK